MMDAKVWTEKVIIPTYGVGKPDKNPMFLEKRVYQGSCGKVYPLPVIDKILDEKEDKEYEVVFLENEYLKIMVLPQFGGRIQRAYDKTNGYDFIYYNEVIKPALVGLTGPWISGGIEFNWPQHHRPTTMGPTDYRIGKAEDGSCFVECSEVDQMYGTKGKMRFTLYQDKAYIEIKGQLYNRTCMPQTFLWWANPAVAVNDYTQSIFPPDVNAVFDHGKRAVSSFPIATGEYYKHDYGAGVDISRYKNIPVPTSYMCAHSDYNFVGGYDYEKKAGILHIADHHVSPGKKQWTWGNGDFGQAWDRNLTDSNGPYIELMTGMYCDNQPDFTWLKPFEEKTFTQYFMPYKAAEDVKNASTELVMNLRFQEKKAEIILYGTSERKNVTILLTKAGQTVFETKTDISPVQVFSKALPLEEAELKEEEYTLRAFDEKGRELLSYSPAPKKIERIPDPMPPAKLPEDIKTNEELYLTGLHIEQYRHATYLPDPYYLEAIKRDPRDIRANNAYGLLLFRRGLFKESESYFRTAISRMTERNPNPYDSEPYYNLGLSLLYQGRDEEAYDAFYKACWTAAQQEMGYYYLAAIDCRRGDYQLALEHIGQSLVKNYHSLKARALKGLILEALGKKEAAAVWFKENLELDAFDYVSGLELDEDKTLTLMAGRASSFIECAIDLAEAGFYQKAAAILDKAPKPTPMVYYHKAYYQARLGGTSSAEALVLAKEADPLYCFPNRLEDILVLGYAIDQDKTDARAPYYLGCLFYDRRQYETAISLWEKSSSLDPSYPTVWRNLSLAYFNKRNDKDRAFDCMKKAYELDQGDARVLLEYDQLCHKLGMSVKERYDFLLAHEKTVLKRDDLYIEFITLLNLQGRHQEAYKRIMERHFHPWEGGEGKVTTQYAVALTQMAIQAYGKGEYAEAIEMLKKALIFPHNLGEGKLEGAKDNNIYYYLGLCEKALGHSEQAQAYLERAGAGNEEPSSALYYNDQPADLILYEGLALKALGLEERAKARFHKLVAYGEKHFYDVVRMDYFAVSLPDLLLFDEDLSVKNRTHCQYLIGLGCLGLGNEKRALSSFDHVLEIDSCHPGAILHKKLLA
ncbi:MAG: DUF5107 domain-containing protein [Treponemataceae bacterium]|nr:DUF5107 domain-containing protein [Treponemataceae bacterium]